MPKKPAAAFYWNLERCKELESEVGDDITADILIGGVGIAFAGAV